MQSPLFTQLRLLILLVGFLSQASWAAPLATLANTSLPFFLAQLDDPDVIVTARGENPPNEGIANIHDGNFNTKWLDVSTTSFVQFAYTVPQTWNAYVLVSGNDFPERDPKDCK